MPFRSQAQARAMYAAASGNSTIGIPASVGQRFVADAKPGSIKRLPKHASKPKPKRGRVFGSLAPAED